MVALSQPLRCPRATGEGNRRSSARPAVCWRRSRPQQLLEWQRAPWCLGCSGAQEPDTAAETGGIGVGSASCRRWAAPAAACRREACSGDGPARPMACRPDGARGSAGAAGEAPVLAVPRPPGGRLRPGLHEGGFTSPQTSVTLLAGGNPPSSFPLLRWPPAGTPRAQPQPFS